MRELLVGCGNARKKLHTFDDFAWDELVTIDHDPNCGADIVHDLNITPWPIEGEFDAIHAYEVLEHLGTQGDAAAFFATFGEIWRLLKHGGHLYATCPSWQSKWAWGDPSHTRIISTASLVFLSQEQYHTQIGKTQMTDFRWLWSGDFETVSVKEDEHRIVFALMAHKPARIF